MGGVSDDANKHCRVYSGAGFKVKGATGVVQECLVAFPFLWVSIVRDFTCSGCLMMLDAAQLLVCECQSLLTLFTLTEQIMLCSSLKYVSGCHASLY